MTPAMLIVFSGLPGTGKSTIGREVARRLRAVFLRIDTIEEPMLSAGWPVEGLGYEVAYVVAEDNLRLGHAVVADCVNPWPLTRAAWHDLADRAGAAAIDVELVCSDAAEHRRRVERRRSGEDGGRCPTWQQVVERDYRQWDRNRLVIDTATTGIDDAVKVIVDRVQAT